jgi:isopenicillin-N N-acyltransferase-like protein
VAGKPGDAQHRLGGFIHLKERSFSKVRHVRIGGKPYQMGVQYGQACPKEIRKAISFWHSFGGLMLTPSARRGKIKLSEMIMAILSKRSNVRKMRQIAMQFEPYIREQKPGLLDRMRGVADGAEVDYRDVLFLNTFPEVITGCSALAAGGQATRTGETFIGMNIDEDNRIKEAQIVLEMEPEEGYRILGTTYAGIVLPFVGINERGLAFNAMFQFARRPEQHIFGFPTTLTLDLVASRCSSAEDAVDLYRRLPHPGNPHVYFFVDTKKCIRIEAALQESDFSVAEDGLLFHCNQPQSAKIKPYDITMEIAPMQRLNADHRTSRMKELIERYRGRIDDETWRKIASDHGEGVTKGKSICQHGLSGATISSWYAIPSQRKYWVCHGQPCKSRFVEYGL